jgi:hypothetical protein
LRQEIASCFDAETIFQDVPGSKRSGYFDGPCWPWEHTIAQI